MPKKILIVEDDSVAREPLADILELQGHTVYAYENAEDAAHHLLEGDADVAVLDVRLPGRFGDAYGEELQVKRPNTRIIFLTGDYRVDELKQRVPGAFVLSKPVDVDVLLQLIES